MTTRSLLMVALLATASARTSGAQDPKPAPPPPLLAPKPGAVITGVPSLEGVAPPAPLSRTELARRLKTIDGSLPDVLPPGASVMVTPGRLDYGRTRLIVHGAEVVGFAPHGAPMAIFSRPQMASGIRVTFDAAGPSIYMYNAEIVTTTGLRAFDVMVSSDDGSQSEPVTLSADGHLLDVFEVPRTGRYTLRIENVLGAGQGWIFYRIELLRVR